MPKSYCHKSAVYCRKYNIFFLQYWLFTLFQNESVGKTIYVSVIVKYYNQVNQIQ